MKADLLEKIMGACQFFSKVSSVKSLDKGKLPESWLF